MNNNETIISVKNLTEAQQDMLKKIFSCGQPHGGLCITYTDAENEHVNIYNDGYRERSNGNKIEILPKLSQLEIDELLEKLQDDSFEAIGELNNNNAISQCMK